MAAPTHKQASRGDPVLDFRTPSLPPFATGLAWDVAAIATVHLSVVGWLTALRYRDVRDSATRPGRPYHSSAVEAACLAKR